MTVMHPFLEVSHVPSDVLHVETCALKVGERCCGPCNLPSSLQSQPALKRLLLFLGSVVIDRIGTNLTIGILCVHISTLFAEKPRPEKQL